MNDDIFFYTKMIVTLAILGWALCVPYAWRIKERQRIAAVLGLGVLYYALNIVWSL